MDIETLKESQIGKIVRRINQDYKNDGMFIMDVASIQANWYDM